jgi:AMP-binding enzyme
MSSSTTIDWFRRPVDSPADGTLNACYNALDRHVIRGHADDVALRVDTRAWTYAELLTEVGAMAGVLRAFGTRPGDTVGVSRLPAPEGVVVTLATSRVGAVVHHADDLAPLVPAAKVLVAATDPALETGDVPVVTVDDSTELSWATVMRAGRTDPAGCADLPGDAVLARAGGLELAVLAALEDGDVPVPEGAALVDVGGLRIWEYAAVEGGR